MRYPPPTSKAHHTTRGRVVYNRRPHIFTITDLIRIVTSIVYGDLRRALDVVIDLYMAIVGKLDWYFVEQAIWGLLNDIWFRIMLPLLQRTGHSITEFLGIVGYVPDPSSIPENPEYPEDTA